MAIALRLSRGGAKKRPYYRIVAADSRAPRDGKYLEQIGIYNPLLAKDDPARVKLNEDRARHWLEVGAQPSDRVARFLDAAGVRERTVRSNPNKGKPGEKANERAEERATKETERKEAEEAAKAEAAAKPAEEVKEEAPVEEAATEAPAEEAKADEAPAEDAKSEDASAVEAKADDAATEDKSEDKAEG